MTRQRKIAVAAVAAFIAALAATAGILALGLGGSVDWATLDHVGDETYASKSQAQEDWGGIAGVPDWLPDDASDIRRVYRTDSNSEAVTLESRDEAPTGDSCDELRRTSTPEMNVPGAPGPREAVVKCGPWSISVQDGTWLAWQNQSSGTG